MANECSSLPFALHRRRGCLAVPISGTKDETNENPARKYVAGPAFLAVHSLGTGIRIAKSTFARTRSRERRRNDLADAARYGQAGCPFSKADRKPAVHSALRHWLANRYTLESRQVRSLQFPINTARHFMLEPEKTSRSATKRPRNLFRTNKRSKCRPGLSRLCSASRLG